MSSFQVLCVTMNQKDFSKYSAMNLHCDTIFANQSNMHVLDEMTIDNHNVKMITTDTVGVGINRNIALMYASADIVLFADDDVVYYNDLEQKILREFNAHPDADMIIFGLDVDDPQRRTKIPQKTVRKYRFSRKPWGAPRIAVRLDSVRKSNVWFTTLFGGGAIFACNEDSMWINDVVHKGFKYYESHEIIGCTSTKTSTWFTGRDEKYYYSQGAYYQNRHKYTKYLWFLYFALRTASGSKLQFGERINWLKQGSIGYQTLKPYIKR